ncbi:nucleotidyltransferase domain-containing protein [Candidatus Woesearchaeota archaeon]|nr:nucleotidyltransferase domain-containing protein [Candidatus Woesearchaeota archaeon]
MVNIAKKDKEILLCLFKDLTNYHNASSIAKEVKISRVGAYKAFKRLSKSGLLKSRKLGKSEFYTLKLGDDFVKKTLELLLMEEAREKVRRWLAEFKELSTETEILILFGSILKSETKAHDVDLLIVLKPENNKNINKLLDKKNEVLIKKIHPLKQTPEDLIKNLKKPDKVVLRAMKTGIVLYGQDKLVEVVKDVTLGK